MTLKARRFRLALLVATMVAMLGALVLAGSSGPLTGLLGGAVAWAAPNAQVSPPAVSFKNSELAAQEGETVSLELNLSSPVSSALVVGYSVAWPEGRPGTGSGTVQFAANTTAATATITVPSDDVVGPRAREDFMISLDQPGSASGYTLGTNQAASVTILEGVCDRSERVQYLILEAVATATECHQVTDSDLSGAPKLTGPLHWGQGKLIPTDESAEVRESKRPWLKAGDFRGMSGATELYLGFNQLKRLPPGVFDGLSNLKILYASHNLIETLEPGVFTGLNSLTELGLGKNLQEKFELSPKLKPLDRNSFTVEIPEGAPLPVSVTLSAEGGILSAGSVTIPAGTTTSPQVTLTPQQEGSAAGVKITDANFTTKEHYYIGVSSDHTLNVPVPTISVANPEVEVTEGSTAQVRLTVSPSPQLPITVNYELGNDGDPDTVDADSFDYDSAGSVTLQSGATGAIVAVDINQDDDIDEGAREFLALRLQEGDDPRQYVRGSVNSATIIIKEGICDRTIAVQSAILTALEKASGECAEVTDDELAQYSGALDISGDVGVASLNSRDFTGLSSLTELNLANATMGTLPRGVFDDLDSLTTLYLHDGSLASLDQNTFAGLTSLTFLRLDNNELAALPAALFSGLTSLDTLYLDNNELAALPSALFSGLTSLESLRLDNNELAALPAALFSGLSNLQTLYLDNNELTALPAALFSGLANLVTLDVRTNKLEALPAGIFLGLDSLSEIYFSDNATENGEPIELTAGLVKSLSLNDDGEFIVTVATPYGWPGSLQANLSGANATPARKEVPLASGNSDSGDITYKWVDVSKDATVCLEPSNGAAIRPGFTTLIGLTFVAAPACFTIQPIQPPPPPPTGPTVTITDARVTQVEGKKAQISFVLSSKATKGFDLRYTTVIDGNDETVDAKEGKDYTTRPARVKVGEDRGTISIPIVDDTEIDEGILEYFVVKLIGPENGKDYRIGSQGITSTVVINDGICDRADIVKKAILGKLPGVSLCHAVTESHLRGIQGTMGLAKKEDPVTLQAGEFRELSALGHLNLSGVNLSQVLLPGLFEGLDSVIALNLCDTNISSLNAGDFSGLGKIAHLSADKNKIKSLPADLFKNVPTLKVVKLYSNEIATLDANVFRHAHSLTMVELQDNELSDLPDGLFKGLTKLTHVQLQENPKSPFKLTPTLREQDTSSFVVEIKEGAPFDISVPFTVIGGTAPVSSVTIPAGKTQAEDEVTVKRTEGNTGTVKVRMSTPIWVGGSTVAAGAKGLLLTAGGPLDLPVPNSESP